MKSKKQYDYEIGKAIQKARRRKKMNQEALADLIGVDRTTISKYESGSNPIDMSVFLQICEVLGVSWADILGDI